MEKNPVYEMDAQQYNLKLAEALKKIQLNTAKYEIESELIIRTARAGFQIQSIPIKTVYQNEKSQINPFVDSLRFIRFISGELFR